MIEALITFGAFGLWTLACIFAGSAIRRRVDMGQSPVPTMREVVSGLKVRSKRAERARPNEDDRFKAA